MDSEIAIDFEPNSSVFVLKSLGDDDRGFVAPIVLWVPTMRDIKHNPLVQACPETFELSSLTSKNLMMRASMPNTSLRKCYRGCRTEVSRALVLCNWSS